MKRLLKWFTKPEYSITQVASATFFGMLSANELYIYGAVFLMSMYAISELIYYKVKD